MTYDDDDAHSEIICCAGPPTCALQGDDAIVAADAGCPLCKHILIFPDGSERELYKKPN